jgi:hypothetical protein
MEHSSEWQCKYCGKKFVSEKYIDKHMDNYHRTLIPVRNERIICNTLNICFSSNIYFAFRKMLLCV